MLKKISVSIVAIIVAVTALAAYVPADSELTGSSRYDYTVSDAQYTWSIPPCLSFSGVALPKKEGLRLAIAPLETENASYAGLLLPENTMVVITAQSRNGFKLKRGDSVIPYYYYEDGDKTTDVSGNGTNEFTILTFTAGKDPNVGVSKTFTFEVDPDDYKNGVKLSGNHDDTMIFRLRQVTVSD